MRADIDAVSKAYELAKEKYAAYGIDTDRVIEDFSNYPMSLHCWQGDDVKGFEPPKDVVSENVVTGSYPGAARNGDELRRDIDEAFSCSPMAHKVNLHSIYAEPDSPVDRNMVTYNDFEGWVNWAKAHDYGLDFNVSFFAHEMMKNGFSLASLDQSVRDYWVKAGKDSRDIAARIGKELGKTCVNNFWIPDGLKDIPANRLAYREALRESLDRIFEKQYDRAHTVDVLEGKLFGIGTESFVVGSHDFYLAYALTNQLGVCMDTGHYHPTETVVDKLSAVAPFMEDILLHISRGIRWDSDHVLIQSDDLSALMLELKRARLFGKVKMGLDYFDASINRVAAWIIGLRAAGKSLLSALLEPSDLLFTAEAQGDYTSRLALMEEFKNLPVNAVWDMLCARKNVPVGADWLERLKQYEMEVQLLRV